MPRAWLLATIIGKNAGLDVIVVAPPPNTPGSVGYESVIVVTAGTLIPGGLPAAVTGAPLNAVAVNVPL